MPQLLPTDTKRLFDAKEHEFESRSLWMDRFSVPDAQDSGADQPRREWFGKLISKRAVSSTLGGHSAEWRHHNSTQIAGSRAGITIYAQLQSRLMVNMAVGVMENAGLCLDRYGLPFVPGSAVKGCARRIAIQSLIELREANASEVQLTEALLNAASVFGWADADWQEGRISKDGKRGSLKSDFEYACGEGQGWVALRRAVTPLLLERFGITKYDKEFPWKSLPNSAGLISFLPAFPVRTGAENLPLQEPSRMETGCLELDVITCHHPRYYSKPEVKTAEDTEEPVPVIFPAVAPGHVFAFSLVPLRGGNPQLLAQTEQWLQDGLAFFGLGAKTNAGFGWFDPRQAVHESCKAALFRAKAQQEQERQKRLEEGRRRAEEGAKAARKAELKGKTANMSAEEKADFEIEALTAEQYRSFIQSFTTQEKKLQDAAVRALRRPPEQVGSRRSFWEEIKAKAQKGGKPAQIGEAIRKISKEMHPGREGKMP